jgi:hypothetical protein
MLGLSSNNARNGAFADGKISGARKHQALLCFFGLTICYRIVYEVRLFSWLDEETESSPLLGCEEGLEVDGSSAQCLEVQLFRSWKRVESDGPEFSEAVEDLERRAQEKLVAHRQEVHLDARPSQDGKQGPQDEDAPMRTASPLGAAEKIDSNASQTMEIPSSHSSTTPYAQKLMDMEARMAGKLAEQKRHLQWEEEFDRLEKQTIESIHSRSTHDYADKVSAMMHDFDAKKANLPSARKARAAARQAKLDKLFNDTLTTINENHKAHENDYANSLKAMQDRLEALNARHPSKTHPHLHSDHSQEIASHNADFNGHVKEREHDHDVWQEAFSTTASDYLTHLCSEEPRRSYPVCSKFLAGQGSKASKASASSASGVDAGTPTAAPKSKFLAPASVDDRLSWTGLLSSLKAPAKGSSKSLVAVERKQLLSQKWQGRLPSVACVVAIDSGSQASTQVKHAVQNFRLQNYEGQRQLLFLYRAADKDVEELVNEHSDGTFIKGVPARSHGVFPSTTSYRFAAWSTDADIIALWEFDEWYHPDRLSMQIRALALTSRPVSLLKRWTVLGSESASFGTVLSDELGWENSIVGEASWMKSHWMPLLHNQREVLAGVQAHSVVQVDMPELSVYLMSDAGSWQGALGHFGLTNHTASPSDMPEACLQVFAAGPNPTGAAKSPLEAAIVDRVGAELAEKYHALATKRQDIHDKLRLLCEEVRDTSEPLQRDMMVGQVEKIAAVEKQLSAHFETVKASF